MNSFWPPRVIEHFKQALALFLGFVTAAALAEVSLRVAARFKPEVRYLATAGANKIPALGNSFEDFLGQFAQLVPHQNFNNYYTNSLGFNDREFTREKPEGSKRIMGLGDSFLYGGVAYPQNVFTLVGSYLNKDCPAEHFETMNLSIAGTGVWEYGLIHKFAAPLYRPDIVIVHFYMGNDGPDLIFETTEVPGDVRGLLKISYAWNYLLNSIKLLRSVEGGPRLSAPIGENTPPRGGERVMGTPAFSVNESVPRMTEPAFAWAEAAELGRLYTGGMDPSLALSNAWRDTISVLEMLRTGVTASTGRGPILVFYPSALQVFPERFEAARRAMLERLPALNPVYFEPTFPNRVLKEYCERAELSCYDITSALMIAAAQNPKPLYFPRDTHWNIRGNHVAAAAEAALLSRELCNNPRFSQGN